MTDLPDQDIYNNLYELIREFIKMNGGVPDDDKFSIEINGDDISSIKLQVWDYVFKKPTRDDLKTIKINTLKRKYQGDVPIVEKASTLQLSRFEIPEGAMVWNTTEDKLMVYINGVWR